MRIEDLLILEIDGADAREWLGYWPNRISGPVNLLCMSKFGDMFLRRPDGSTEKFSLLDGGKLNRVATTAHEFLGLMASEEWRSVQLMADRVKQLHAQGIIPDETQCYGFAPHPLLSGKIDVEHAMVLDIGTWHFTCARLFEAMETGRRR